MIWKAEKPLRRCSVQMLVTQDVFWPGTVHNGWVEGCWKRHTDSRWGLLLVVFVSVLGRDTCLLLFRRGNKGWLYVIIQHWCIDGAAALIYLTFWKVPQSAAGVSVPRTCRETTSPSWRVREIAFTRPLGAKILLLVESCRFSRFCRNQEWESKNCGYFPLNSVVHQWWLLAGHRNVMERNEETCETC